MPFRLSPCARFVIEDDAEPHPTHWTIAEAKGRQGRLEAEAASWERSYDRAIRAGRTIDADTAKVMLACNAGKALELFTVLQGIGEREAA